MPKIKSKPIAKNSPRKSRKGRTFECRRAGTNVIWPAGADARYGINSITRWRWEKEKKLPPRDVFVNGEAIGWKPETLDAADRGEYKAGAR